MVWRSQESNNNPTNLGQVWWRWTTSKANSTIQEGHLSEFNAEESDRCVINTQQKKKKRDGKAQELKEEGKTKPMITTQTI